MPYIPTIPTSALSLNTLGPMLNLILLGDVLSLRDCCFLRRLDISCELVHELHSKLESSTSGVNLHLEEPLGVGEGGIDEPPGQTWLSPPALPCDGIIGHSLIHVVDSTSIGIIVLDGSRYGDGLDCPKGVTTINGRFLRWWVE